jgi:hypothetical protein
MLFMICELLHRRYHDRNIVFLGRDCQLLHKLYTTYYDLAYYLPFSRQVAYHQPDTALHYLRTHSPEQPVYFDLSSTGGTWQKLNANIDITVAVYSDLAYYTPQQPTLPAGFDYLTANSMIGPTALMLEVMNSGDHGHLNSIQHYQDNLMQVTFGEPEIPAEFVTAIHAPVHLAQQLATIYQDAIREELSTVSVDQLIQHFGQLAVAISTQDLLQMIPDFQNKETNYLEQFTHEQNSQ